MGRINSLALRGARSVGARLTNAGTRLSARAVTEGEVEPRGESLDASSLIRNGWKAPPIDVVWYFPDTVTKIYQIQQWLPVIAAHSGDINFGIVTRTRSAWLELMRVPDLPAPSFLAAGFPALMELYRVLEPKAIVYPNNGLRNFQSLIWAEAAHIHVNHGESDKASMVSNQAKAYDRIFVAGEAAVRRHRAALVDFDEFRLVRIGRPQLDLNPKPSIQKSPLRTILYAPTWEGEDDSNNFTSVDCYGPRIIEALLAQPGTRVVYKPHPRVPLSLNAKVAAAHGRIVEAIAQAESAQPDAGHMYLPDGDILSVFPRVDMLISDISSVGLDFLYSRPEAPIVLTDRRTDRPQLLREAPIADGSHVIDRSTIATLRDDLPGLINDDPFAAKRSQLRQFYFDDAIPGSSTARFHAALLETLREHGRGVESMRAIAARGTWPIRD